MWGTTSYVTAMEFSLPQDGRSSLASGKSQGPKDVVSLTVLRPILQQKPKQEARRAHTAPHIGHFQTAEPHSTVLVAYLEKQVPSRPRQASPRLLLVCRASQGLRPISPPLHGHTISFFCLQAWLEKEKIPYLPISLLLQENKGFTPYSCRRAEGSSTHTHAHTHTRACTHTSSALQRSCLNVIRLSALCPDGNFRCPLK